MSDKNKWWLLFNFICFGVRGTDDVRTFLEDTEEEVEIPAYIIPA